MSFNSEELDFIVLETRVLADPFFSMGLPPESAERRDFLKDKEYRGAGDVIINPVEEIEIISDILEYVPNPPIFSQRVSSGVREDVQSLQDQELASQIMEVLRLQKKRYLVLCNEKERLKISITRAFLPEGKIGKKLQEVSSEERDEAVPRQSFLNRLRMRLVSWETLRKIFPKLAEKVTDRSFADKQIASFRKFSSQYEPNSRAKRGADKEIRRPLPFVIPCREKIIQRKALEEQYSALLKKLDSSSTPRVLKVSIKRALEERNGYISKKEKSLRALQKQGLSLLAKVMKKDVSRFLVSVDEVLQGNVRETPEVAR